MNRLKKLKWKILSYLNFSFKSINLFGNKISWFGLPRVPVLLTFNLVNFLRDFYLQVASY